MSSDEVEEGWSLAIRYRAGTQWGKREAELRSRDAAAAKLYGKTLGGSLVKDARPKRLASKLRKMRGVFDLPRGDLGRPSVGSPIRCRASLLGQVH